MANTFLSMISEQWLRLTQEKCKRKQNIWLVSMTKLQPQVSDCLVCQLVWFILTFNTPTKNIFETPKRSLLALEFPSSGATSQEYLAWIKQMTRKGYAVTICVYMNYYLFYNISKSNAGDNEYDHIVSVYEIQSDYGKYFSLILHFGFVMIGLLTIEFGHFWCCCAYYRR